MGFRGLGDSIKRSRGLGMIQIGIEQAVNAQSLRTPSP